MKKLTLNLLSLSLILIGSVLSFALFSTAPAHADPETTMLLIHCTPSDHSLFAFILSSASGCEFTPGGPICQDRIDFEVLGFDPVAEQWSAGEFIDGLPNTAVVDHQNNTFSYHFLSANGLENIDIETTASSTSVNIAGFGGFNLVPSIDTRGTQTSYACTFQ